ncbi:MAG TPA: hypothetical protein VF808_11010 [Ktedonobacterales bacterium]
MAYEVVALIRRARQQTGGVEALAASIGQAEASAAALHKEAQVFWEAALALEGADALTDGERAFAQAQVALHAGALVPTSASPRPHVKAV